MRLQAWTLFVLLRARKKGEGGSGEGERKWVREGWERKGGEEEDSVGGEEMEWGIGGFRG